MRALDEAEQACVRARQLTWQLLTFSRGGVPVKKTIAIPRILKESAGLALRGSNVSCTLRHRAGPLAVSADEGQLVQVFTNMLINAQQAMPHGGAIRIRAENVVEPGAPGPHALRVDAGPLRQDLDHRRGHRHSGRAPRQDLRSVLQHEAERQRPRSRHVVLDHQEPRRLVSVESKPGQGTTLRVNLPASTSCELALEPPARLTPRMGGGPGRILVMDDEASIRMLAVNMLTFLGHDAEVVDNGTAAVEQYARALKTGEPFDAVILDLIVPGGVGAREAMELLSEVDPAVKAIVVSGYAQDPAMTEYRDYGFKAVIAKPFTLEELNSDPSLRHGHGQWPGALAMALTSTPLLGGRAGAAGGSDRAVRVVLADDECLFRASLRQLLAVPAAGHQRRLRRGCRPGLRGRGGSRKRRRHRQSRAVGPARLSCCSICRCRACRASKRCASWARAATACARSCWPERSIGRSLLTAVHLGVHGLLLKDVTTEVLFEAIMCVMAGRYWLGQTLVSDLLETVRPLIESSSAAGGQLVVRAHAARASGADDGRGRVLEQGDRRAMRHQRADHQAPPDPHVRQARGLQPARACDDRDRTRPGSRR